MEEDWEDLGLPWSEKVNWIMGNARKYMFHSKLAKLLIPYYDLQVDISIQPTRAIEYISLDFTVDPPMTQEQADEILKKAGVVPCPISTL